MSSSTRICHYGDWLDVPTCRRGKEMNIITAWTDMNPGRRYWECGGKGYRKCRYWEWIDPPMCHRLMKIIPRLLKKKNSMEEEVTMLKKRIKQQQAGSKIGKFAFGFVVGVLFVCVLCLF
ncbi:hypothetical protein DM860_000958 [Cuscuta australis]|uniref:Uncharacterized protein n=1 Tax=Cuscuta australis TaxID=267555 RepID=A0A328DVW6_9ASTE|nr:hypothetical protein DM860_000958 [Cuscuta australis]